MDASVLENRGGDAPDDSYDGLTLAAAVVDGPGTVTEELPEGGAPNDPDQKEGRADDPGEEDDLFDDFSDIPAGAELVFTRKLPTLVLINGKPATRPTKESIANFGYYVRPDVMFHLRLSPCELDYRRLSMDYYTLSGNGKRIHFGRTEFYLDGISKVGMKYFNKEATTELLQRFTSDAEAPCGCYQVIIKVERLQYHIKPELHAKADDDTRRTLDLLQSEFGEITAATPCEVELLIQEDNSPQVGEKFPALIKGKPVEAVLWVFQQLWETSRKSDPLRLWFIRAPRAEVLNAGTILRRGVAYGDPPNVYRRPAIESVPAMIKFWNLRQYCVYQVYGNVDEADNTEGSIEELNQVEFTCRVALLRTAYGADQNPDTALILVSYNKEGDHLLPDQGENCKIMIDGIERVANEPYKDIDFALEVFHFITRRMDFAVKSDLGQDDYLKPGVEDSRREEILAHLKQVYEFHTKGDELQRDSSLKALIKSHRHFLTFPDIALNHEEAERLAYWPAYKSDAALPAMDHRARFYIAKLPLEPWHEAVGGPRRPVKVQLPQPAAGQPYIDFIQDAFDRSQCRTCRFTMRFSDKTLRQEIQAFAEAKYPRCAPDLAHMKPHPRSEAILHYVTSFESVADEDVVDLFKVRPAMARVMRNEAPYYLQKLWNDLDSSQQDTYRALTRCPLGLLFVPGVAGAGKSTWAVFTLLSHLESRQPQEPGEQRPKVLIVAPTNQALDDYVGKIEQTFDRVSWPEDRRPKLERVFGIPMEISAGTRRLLTPANDAEFGPTEEPPTLETMFVADSILNAFYKTSSADKKRRAHQGFGRGASMTAEPRPYWFTQAKKELKSAYGSLLGDAEIVIATPAAARETLLREFFKPTLVIMDEQARQREITTIMTLTSFPSVEAAVLVGDIAQPGPVVKTEKTGIDGREGFVAPFAGQLKLSLLERADRSGAACRGLTINHRSYGNLSKLPSRQFYDDKMTAGNEEQWPAHVKVVSSWLRTIHPSTALALESNRVVLDIENSEERLVGTSFTNPVHVQAVLGLASKILGNAHFVGADGKPGRVGIFVFYKAQLSLYIHRLKNDKIYHRTDTLDWSRIDIRTLDGSQGHEVDVAFIDAVRSKSPGFIGEKKRQCLATTHGKQGEVYVLREASFKNWHRPAVNRDTREIYDIYHAHRKEKQLVVTELCVKCGELGHVDAQCAGDQRCDFCLGSGHDKSACPKLECKACGALGHLNTECNAVICKSCNKEGHKASECTEERVVTCNACGKVGHKRRDCPDKIKEFSCFRCGEMGHKKSECHKADKDTPCTDCGRKGHLPGLDLCAKNNRPPRLNPKRQEDSGNDDAPLPTTTTRFGQREIQTRGALAGPGLEESLPAEYRTVEYETSKEALDKATAYISEQTVGNYNDGNGTNDWGNDNDGNGINDWGNDNDGNGTGDWGNVNTNSHSSNW
ncbi:hypothetical protein DL768_002597 [Monosporascus sp. mg162]|nr:hypothetical protein DL768_002597 [Monosporascus sp. mg162]